MNRSGPPTRFAPPHLMDLLLQIEESLEHPWTHREMAERAGFSISRFYQVFLDGVGEPPMQYLERLRLERAAVHLVYSSWNILEIALLAGFQSHAGFTHAFTARYGVSPSTFRQRHGVRGPLFGVPRRRPPASRGIPPGTGEAPAPEVLPVPGFRIAFVRQWGYDPRGVPAAWSILARWVRERGLDPGVSRPVGLHYDDVRFTPAERCRYDAGIEVGPDFDPRGEVAVRDVPSGWMACLPYEGPLGGLPGAWQSFTDSWLPHSGYVPRTFFVFDRMPGFLLSQGIDSALPERRASIRATLWIPVSPAPDSLPNVWVRGPLDSLEDDE